MSRTLGSVSDSWMFVACRAATHPAGAQSEVTGFAVTLQLIPCHAALFASSPTNGGPDVPESVSLPGPDTRWRCAQCGNLTRFDVVRRQRVREYWHVELGGEPVIEESETLAEEIEQVRCRWCGAVDRTELVARPAVS